MIKVKIHEKGMSMQILFPGFPSCGIVQCFQISIDSLVFRAKNLPLEPEEQTCPIYFIALFFDAAFVVFFLSYRQIASGFTNVICSEDSLYCYMVGKHS